MSPAGCQIPSHVTGLYIFAVLNLSLLLNITFTDANILILDRENRTIGKIEHEYEAHFGPSLTDEGVWGHIALTNPRNGCSIIDAPPDTSTEWIALIRRGQCDFDVKVLNAQIARYKAAIVYNNESDDLVPMGGGKNGDKVTIPSVFIGISDAEYLYHNFDRVTEYAILIDDESPFSLQLYLVPFAIVVAICFVLMLVFMVVKWVRDYNKRRRSRLSKSHLKKIPVKKFKKGDDYDVCAICIDEYEEGEKLRILPCSHAYHQKCIDPWLTKNKKTCPICKRKVMPGREDTSDSDSGSDEETRPLLPAQDMRRGPVGGNTFDNSGLPENVRSQLLRIPDSSSSDDSDGGAMIADPSSSLHQSSVEVHSGDGALRSSSLPRQGRTSPAVSALTSTSPLLLAHRTASSEPCTASTSPAAATKYEVADETASETASSVGIFGGPATEEEYDDEEAALLGAVGGSGAVAGKGSLHMDLSEDHFSSIAAQAHIDEDEQASADHVVVPVDDKTPQDEEEVLVVSGKRNKRKKKSNRKRNQDA